MKLDDEDNKIKSIVLKPPLWMLKYRYGEEEQQIKLVELTDTERISCNRELESFFFK
jgi:hypothetical protein